MYFDLFPQHIIIKTENPPKDVPLTLGGALLRFTPPNVYLHYPSKRRDDILTYTLSQFSFPSDAQCHEILQKLEKEVEIRAVHFIPPQIFVEIELTSPRYYERHSLPAEAGGVRIQYHQTEDEFFGGRPQVGCEDSFHPVNPLLEGPKPSKMVRIEELRCGEWFEVESPSTSRLDLCVQSKTYEKQPEGILPLSAPE